MPRKRALSGQSLTVCELRVVQALAAGMTMAEAGEYLFVSENTVKSHCANVRVKLGARNTLHAVVLADRAGLLGGES